MGVAILVGFLILLLKGDGGDVRGCGDILTVVDQVIKFLRGKALPLVVSLAVRGDRDGQDGRFGSRFSSSAGMSQAESVIKKIFSWFIVPP